uniref:Paired box protein Pax-6 n=1 Tax=Pseudonaja textilis TaxID=8673 RepID=A0A670ZUY8_PSETE
MWLQIQLQLALAAGQGSSADPRAVWLHSPGERQGMNQLGGFFVAGCPLPDAKRKKIVELALCGLRAADISHQLKVSSGCVSKILTRYYKVGLVQPKTREGSRPQIATPQLVAVIAQLKQERPSLFAWEIREKLEAAGTCAASGIPSVSGGGRIADTGPLCVCLRLELLLPGVQPPHSGGSPCQTLRGGPLPALTCSFPLSAFQRSQYPEAAAREELAGQSGLPEATLKVWFSNRRARGRREALRAQHAGSGPATPGTYLACQRAALEGSGWEAAAAFLFAPSQPSVGQLTSCLFPGAACEWRLPIRAPSLQPPSVAR